MAKLEIDDVTMSFGDVVAVDRVSLKVAEGGEGWGEGYDLSRGRFPPHPRPLPDRERESAVPQSQSVLITKVCVNKNGACIDGPFDRHHAGQAHDQ